jgi:hypothetical protein
MAIELQADLLAQTQAADKQLQGFPPGFSYHLSIYAPKILDPMLRDVETKLLFSHWKRKIDGATILREPATGSNIVSVWLIRNV